MKQKKLAKIIKVSNAHISLILSGKKRPSWSKAKRLSKAIPGTMPADWMEAPIKAKNLKRAVEKAA